jgi:hypothetical protein
MKTQDEVFQEQIEKGIHDTRDVDSRAYQIVFNGVSKKPNVSLSTGFTHSVIRKIQQIKEERSLRIDFMWLGIGLFAFIIATIISISLTNFKFDFGALGFINSYGGLLIFGAILIIGLQWLDKKLVINTRAD